MKIIQLIFSIIIIIIFMYILSPILYFFIFNKYFSIILICTVFVILVSIFLQKLYFKPICFEYYNKILDTSELCNLDKYLTKSIEFKHRPLFISLILNLLLFLSDISDLELLNLLVDFFTIDENPYDRKYLYHNISINSFNSIKNYKSNLSAISYNFAIVRENIKTFKFLYDQTRIINEYTLPIENIINVDTKVKQNFLSTSTILTISLKNNEKLIFEIKNNKSNLYDLNITLNKIKKLSNF